VVSARALQSTRVRTRTRGIGPRASSLESWRFRHLPRSFVRRGILPRSAQFALFGPRRGALLFAHARFG